MEEKFKSYLEAAFRAIAPTKAAMEYRKKTLKEMKDRAQELRIKGMTDEELIIDTVLSEYEDLPDKLTEFEKREVAVHNAKRNVILGLIVAVAVVVLLAISYVIIGVIAHVWHPTWLIMVGGIFMGLIVVFILVGAKALNKKKYGIIRLLVALSEALVAVFVFLLLQIVFLISGSWLTFLAMVALVLGTDTVVAFFVDSKIRWIELPFFVETFSVMLYVTLGILVSGFWHPGWLLCLVGVVFALIEIIILLSIRNGKKDKKEKAKIFDKHVRTDESYWTEWDD